MVMRFFVFKLTCECKFSNISLEADISMNILPVMTMVGTLGAIFQEQKIETNISVNTFSVMTMLGTLEAIFQQQKIRTNISMDTFSAMTMVGTTEASSEAVSRVFLERPGFALLSSLLMRF